MGPNSAKMLVRPIAISSWELFPVATLDIGEKHNHCCLALLSMLSQWATHLPLECGPSLHGYDVGSHYVRANRPWLNLYGARVRKPALNNIDEDGWFEGKVPEEVMLTIFSKLDPYAIGRASCSCRIWRIWGSHPLLWQRACVEAFAHTSFQENVKRARFCYQGSWRKMFIERPHLRYNGLYISRNTYLRTGITEWRVKNPVHLVAYFRYIRFYPGGNFIYRTSPEKPNRISRLMKIPMGSSRRMLSTDASGLLEGRYGCKEDLLCCVTVYPNSQSTELRIKLRLRSTSRGAHDRLDVESITTRSSDGFETVVSESPDPDAEELEEEIKHKRGTAPFVFVPWERIETSPLNLPIDKMDFYVPG